MQNSMVMFTFSVFDWKYHFWVNLVQKVKIVSWNLLLRLIRICIIQWWCSLFLFSVENALPGQIWSKLSIFTAFFVSDQKCPFLGKFGPKNQNHQFKLKFGTYINSNMQSSMVMLTFSGFDRQYPFWANLIQ